MKPNKITTWATLLLLGSLTLLSACQRESTPAPTGTTTSVPAQGKSVTVAANLPLTGFLAVYGEAIREGATLAAESNGDVNVRFDWQDNASDPATAATILRQQQLQAPQIYVSGLKPQAMAIKDEVTRLGLPNFVWILDARIGQGPTNNFRTLPNYGDEAKTYLDYADRRQARRVSIIYAQLPHAVEEFEQIVMPALKGKGVAVEANPFQPGTTDFSAAVLKAKKFRPDLVILSGFQPDLVGLTRGLRTQRMVADGNVIATFDMLETASLLGADETEGIRVVVPEFTVSQRSEVQQWREIFQKRFGKQSTWMHAFAYDMETIIVDATKRVPQQPTSAQWIDALRKTSIAGITGPLRFDEQGSLITELRLGVFRNGSVVEDRR